MEASRSSAQLAKPQEGSRKKVWIKTFGCQMNEYDSEKMLGLLAGTHERVETPEEADLAIVNTCSVREKAEHKLFSLLGRLKELKDEKPEMLIGVGGCVAQQEGASITKRSRAVDFVVGTHNLSLVPSLVERATQGYEPGVAIDYREDWEDLAPNASGQPDIGGVQALVAIQRGCDKHCAFCVVPNTRGTQVSRDPEEVLREIALKARLGAKEVMLLGQTVNSYGLDLNPRIKFENLIRRIADIQGIERIRFTSPHPQEVRRGFIELYSEVEQLSPHIHLPLQSGSDRILKLMNRNYRRDRYLDIVSALKDQCPSISLTADIIVGFPTETDEDFQDTLDIVNRVEFSSSYSFLYSKRPGTKALEFKEEEEVPREIAGKRLQELQARQTALSLKSNEQWIGKEVEVLIEGDLKVKDTGVRGRIPQNTLMEVSLCKSSVSPKPGELVQARVVSASPHVLRGELV